MRSLATTVREYVDGQPDEWRPTLKKLRAACRRELVGYHEGMSYGMPSYARDGQVEVSYAKQAHHLSFYILKQSVFDSHRPELAGSSLGKGCIRYRRPEQVNWDLVRRLLVDTRCNDETIC